MRHYRYKKARCGWVTLNEVLINYDLTYLFIYALKTLFETSKNRQHNANV